MSGKKIAIDVRNANKNNISGGGIYLKSLLRHMLPLDSLNHYLLYLDSEVTEALQVSQGSNVEIKTLHSPFLWTQLRLPSALLSDQPDIYFSPHHWLPLLSSKCQKVVTIHDLAFFKYPKYFGTRSALYFKLNTCHAINRADKIITISEASKKDILNHFKIPEKKIRVIHLGYDDIFSTPLENQKSEAVLKKYNIDGPYLFFLGDLHLRKNVQRVIQAFEILKNSHKKSELKLVISGKQAWLADRLFKLVENSNVRDEIFFTGYVPRDELPYIMGNAQVFVFPSLFEGFGIPILEAMAAGTPVVTSNVTSMPEVAGEAAILVNPYDISEITNAIQTILDDRALKKSMIEKGKKRIENFSWAKTAQETLDFINQ